MPTDPGECLALVSIAELAQLAKVDRTTAMRWKRGRTRCPAAIIDLIKLRVEGDAEALLCTAWRGWRFGRDGLLYAPAWRRGFAPGEILALPFLHGQVKALQRQQIEQLRARRLDLHHPARRRPRRIPA